MANYDISTSELNEYLSDYRNALRKGRLEVTGSLRASLTSYLGISEAGWNGTLSPRTIKRLNVLFDTVPAFETLSTSDYAKAVQNFINRRALPWEFMAFTSKVSPPLEAFR